MGVPTVARMSPEFHDNGEMTGAELPSPVRSLLVRWASETLGQLPAAQIPAGLIRVARFTPAKRARLGAVSLSQAVESDAGFRAAVAEWVRGAADPDADPVHAAALAHLLGLPTEAELLAEVRDAQPDPGDETAQLRHTVRALRTELRQITTERDDARRRQVDPTAAVEEQLEKLRRRLREQGTRLRQAEEAILGAGQVSADERDTLRREVQRLTAELTRSNERARLATERADRAQDALGRLREQTGVRRATADRRLDLLLTTVEGAVYGLRREWELTGGGAEPADVVASRLPGVPSSAAASTDEPSRLNAWLGLPAAHLVVDGYNVSKTAVPDLTLALQRDRLVRLLGALAARTSAEITVVFDGAAVAVPAPPGRGVRVLFSPPGVTADDVIRDLVAAEPVGRVVIVVSSDREVADGVLRRGAKTAGAAVLLPLLY